VANFPHGGQWNGVVADGLVARAARWPQPAGAWDRLPRPSKGHREIHSHSGVARLALFRARSLFGIVDTS
jgi:hypothetical protein